MWVQIYNPLGVAWLSTLAAAAPIVLLMMTLGVLEWRAHWAALSGLVCALIVSVVIYGMPADAAAATALYGAAYGLLPIGWIVLNAVFLYNITVATGQFDIVRNSVASLSSDRRIQALLIAFSFGAFIEGAAGFGTPVAICAALLPGLSSALRGGTGAHRQHGAGCVRRHRHADPHVGRGHRHFPDDAQRDGRTAAPHRLDHRARLAGRDDEWMARADGCVAGRPRVGRIVRDRAGTLGQLRRPRAGGHRRGPRFAGVADALLPVVDAGRIVGLSQARSLAPSRPRVRRSRELCTQPQRARPCMDALGIPQHGGAPLGPHLVESPAERWTLLAGPVSSDGAAGPAQSVALSGIRRAQAASPGVPRVPRRAGCRRARANDRRGVSEPAGRSGAVHIQLAVGRPARASCWLRWLRPCTGASRRASSRASRERRWCACDGRCSPSRSCCRWVS
jgi:hypothetical protein